MFILHHKANLGNYSLDDNNASGIGYLSYASSQTESRAGGVIRSKKTKRQAVDDTTLTQPPSTYQQYFITITTSSEVIDITGCRNKYTMMEYATPMEWYSTTPLAMQESALRGITATSNSTRGSGTGMVTTNFGPGRDIANCMTMTPDGKIVLGGAAYNGSTNDFALARYNWNGKLDTSFSQDGLITENISVYIDDEIRGIESLADGSLLVAGGERSVQLAKYTYSGNLDRAFGNGGIASWRFSTPILVKDMAIQANDRIVVVGDYSENYRTSQFCITRFLPNGQIDSSFNNGIVYTPYGTTNNPGYAEATSVAIQPDGRIVVAGAYKTTEDNFDLMIVRYLGNGSLDASFDGDGKAFIILGTGYDEPSDVIIQQDGKILLSAQTYIQDAPDTGSLQIVCINPNGSLDSSFGDNGVVRTPIGTDAAATEMLLLEDGRLLVSGYARIASNYSIITARYLSNGALDTSFSQDGIAIADIGPGGDGAFDLAVQPDGHIVVAGVSYAGEPDEHESPTLPSTFAVVRFNADGSLDTTFGSTQSFEAPLITSNGGETSSTISILENGAVVTTVSATDVDSARIIYSLSGGADQSLFSINRTTGVLRFILAPDYERPLDAGVNNTYDVIVRASDGFLSDTQQLSISVRNIIEGTPGRDNLMGTSGNDVLYGYSGNDTLTGGIGADTMVGGGGNDLYIIDSWNDQIIESSNGGTDTVQTEFSFSIIQSSYSQLENIRLTGSAATDAIGNARNNVLTGNAGMNRLAGGDGNDTLFGNIGNDTLNGGLGNNFLTGGTGSDSFVFSTQMNFGRNTDTIADFVSRTDKINLSASVFNGIGALGNFTANDARFRSGISAQDSTDRIIYNQSTGAVYFDPDGSGVFVATQFASLGVSSHPALVATDIMIY